MLATALRACLEARSNFRACQDHCVKILVYTRSDIYRALSHLNPRSRVDEILVQVECRDEIDVRVQGHLFVIAG